MRKGMTFLILLAVVLTLFGGSAAAQEATMDPAQTVMAVYAAVEAKDLEGAGALLVEDVILVILPAPPGTNGAFVGKQAVLEWYEHLIQANTTVHLSNAEVSGDRFTMTNDTWMADMPFMMSFDGTGIVQDGLVKTMSWVMTPETVAKLDASIAQEADEALVHRYMYLWDTVNGELEGAEEILAEEFVSHGAPEGDRQVMIADIAGFREENPGAYFQIDELTLAGEKAYVSLQMWLVPEGAAAEDPGEPVGSPYLLVLGLRDGQITDRWLFVTPE